MSAATIKISNLTKRYKNALAVKSKKPFSPNARTAFFARLN